MKNKNAVDAQCAQYERIRPNYERFTEKIRTLIVEILQVKNIGYHLIEARTKQVSSFREKIARPNKSYTSPADEVTDLAGLRIITYYEDDAALVGKLIESEFIVDYTNYKDYAAIGPEFGYRSKHYIIRLNDSRKGLVEWAALAELRAEIQVRTVLQHTWAAISHKLQYKREADIPHQLQRRLLRLSALFELADNEFISLRDDSQSFSRSINSLFAEGERNLRLDSVSLRYFIERSPVVSELCVLADEIGFNFEDSGAPDDLVRDSISDLILLARYAGLDTLDQFENALVGASSWAKEYLTVQYTRGGNSDMYEWYVSPAFICELILIRSCILRLRPVHLIQTGWHRSTAWRVFKIAREFRPPK